MAGKVKTIHQKKFYYSRIMKQILMFNRLFKSISIWLKIKQRKIFFHQYGRRCSKWPTKSKNLSKSCYNSRIMQPISMFNSLFERYLDWAIIYNFRKFYILYQYGRQNSKYPKMSKNLQKSCYNSGIMRQISMSNSLSCLEGTYFDWTEILV